jgi:hypothetical protein
MGQVGKPVTQRQHLQRAGRTLTHELQDHLLNTDVVFGELLEDAYVIEIHTVYALDSTTIDLCLSLFPWAPFRSSKAVVKMHTLLDQRGNIPSCIHVSDGRLQDVNVLDMMISANHSDCRTC